MLVRKPPNRYFLDKSDSDILILRQKDGTFIAAFSARGAIEEGIADAAKGDLTRRWWASQRKEDRR